MPTGSARRLVSPYADALLARDLPALDPARRADTVEFVASWQGGSMHEVSRFEQRAGRWCYVDGVVSSGA